MDYPAPPCHRSNPPPITVEIVAAESSPSPLRKSKARLTDCLEIVADELPEPAVVRQRRKCRESSTTVGQSPKKARRARKRSSEVAIREEKDLVLAEEVGKPRKRRNNVRSKKEKVNLVPCVPYSSSSLTLKAVEENVINLDRVGQLLGDLIMWKDLSKSVLWFGFGSLCFLSSFFTKGLNFSIFSAMSQLAIPFLGFSFFSNSILLRNQAEKNCEFKLKESDVLRLAKLILPALNFAISKTRVLFSGEPSMTLKVAPFLLLGAEYGHFITMWRLCAIGFIGSFTVPKLYSSYSAHINKRYECMKSWLLNTWCACTHKKKMIAAALMAFWNLSSVKTRIFTAFILLVLFRYVKEHVLLELADGEAREIEKEQQQAPMVVESDEKETPQASVLAEPEEKEPHQALLVWEEQSVPKPAP